MSGLKKTNFGHNLFVACCIVVGLCLQSSSVWAKECFGKLSHAKYFRSLAEITTLAEPFDGVVEVSPDQTANIAHFRITYDDCGFIGEIQYFHGDIPKPIDENYTSNRFVPTSQMTFKRDGSEVRIHFFDHTNKPQIAFQNVFSVRLVHDGKNKLLQADFLDAEGGLTDSSLGYASIKWLWRNDLSVIESRYDAAGELIIGKGEFPFAKARIEFDPDGFAKTIKLLEEEYKVEIKRNGNKTRHSWRIYKGKTPYRGGAANIAGIDFSYDENGYLIRAKYLDEHGNLALTNFGHMGFRRIYNEDGNRLGYYFLNAEGEDWIPPARGYAGQLFHWRKDGIVRIKTEYVDVSGKPMDHPNRGYSTILYEFDARNRTIGQKYFDMNRKIIDVPAE